VTTAVLIAAGRTPQAAPGAVPPWSPPSFATLRAAGGSVVGAVAEPLAGLARSLPPAAAAVLTLLPLLLGLGLAAGAAVTLVVHARHLPRPQWPRLPRPLLARDGRTLHRLRRAAPGA
jgi:hypothetical protein